MCYKIIAHLPNVDFHLWREHLRKTDDQAQRTRFTLTMSDAVPNPDTDSMSGKRVQFDKGPKVDVNKQYDTKPSVSLGKHPKVVSAIEGEPFRSHTFGHYTSFALDSDSLRIAKLC